MEDGLPNNVIKGIVEDHSGHLWLTTNKGISRYDIDDQLFWNYDVSDGLQSNEFVRNSIFKSKKGKIFAGGVNGFNVFHPDSLKANLFEPPIVITDFKIFNRPVEIGVEKSPLKKHISETKQLVLSHHHSVISFEFAALNYISSKKNQYAYLLEGFENDWNFVGTQRTATYTNLDPGEYIFRVKGSNNDGTWNEQGTSIHIIVEPPFWKTWWAYSAYMLFFIGIVIMIARHFIGRERLKNALKLEHIELEKMYELDHMKSRFFTNVSHEFRTPITLITGPLEPIIANDQLNPKIKKNLQLIYRNARRLLRMTNQLMDFHKIEAGELLLELSQGDIIQFVRETALSFKDYAQAHQIDFTIKTNIDNHNAWFDPDKLDKIIYNLLSNAFKFTPDAGNITVSTRIKSSLEKDRNHSTNKINESSEFIEIVVSDNGIGIPENKLKHIFNRFYQFDDQTKYKYQGSGVGLALVSELLNLYHGKIDVKSSEGKGSTFTVQIPLDAHYLENNQLVSEFVGKQVDHPDLMDDDTQDLTTSLSHRQVGESQQTDETEGKNLPAILVIDDDSDIRIFIRDDFNPDFRLYNAENGLVGYQKAVEVIPDLIICDIMMPVMDGTEVCLKLKSDERTSHIPIILLTARSSDEHRIRGLKIGADAFVTKPFNMGVLRAQVINLLNSRTNLKQKFSTDYLIGQKEITASNIDKQFLNRAVEIVKQRINDPDLNADMLSKRIGMSRMQLYRKFRGLTDQTVHEFIRSIRLKVASQLLLKKRVTVTEVAFEVGFKDLTYFARCFRQQFGVSPSAYMSQQK